MNWTQNICQRCWYAEHPDRTPVRERYASEQQCCMCGAHQHDGIWIRRDPSTVRFPAED